MDRALREAWPQTPPLWRHPAPAGQVPPRGNHTFHTCIQDICDLKSCTAISQSCLSLGLPTLGRVTGRAEGRACPRVLISVVTIIAGVCAYVQLPPLQTSAPPRGADAYAGSPPPLPHPLPVPHWHYTGVWTACSMPVRQTSSPAPDTGRQGKPGSKCRICRCSGPGAGSAPMGAQTQTRTFPLL